MKQSIKMKNSSGGAGLHPILSSKSNSLQQRLQGAIERRQKLTDELKSAAQKMDSSSAIRNAQILAQYAVLALIFEKMFAGMRNHLLKKQLDKLGKKELEHNEKLNLLKSLGEKFNEKSQIQKAFDESNAPAEEKEKQLGLLDKYNADIADMANSLGLTQEEIEAIEGVSQHPIFGNEKMTHLEVNHNGQDLTLAEFREYEDGSLKAKMEKGDGSFSILPFPTTKLFVEMMDPELKAVRELTDEQGNLKISDETDSKLLEQFIMKDENGQFALKPEYDGLKFKTDHQALSDLKGALNDKAKLTVDEAVRGLKSTQKPANMKGPQ